MSICVQWTGKEKLTASVANCMPFLVSSPQGCDCGSAVLARDHDSRVLVLGLKVQGANVDGGGWIVCGTIR